MEKVARPSTNIGFKETEQQDLFMSGNANSSKKLSDKEKLNWLRLIRTENIGPITFDKLIARFGSAESALQALPEMAAKGGRKKPLLAAPIEEIEKEIELTEKYGAKIIAKCEDEYPYLLKQIEDAPPVITVLGRVDIFNDKALAIVGTRNASINGRKMATNIAKYVGEAGYKIVSGLARGIDTCVHEASITTGTIAVIAGGIDVIYPKENEKLYAKIAAEGVIVAESPFSTQPQARHFPKRNRIISGISLGCLVVEASIKSGSLITARMALEQNRELFAIPGSPLDPRASGTNKLLQENSAHLVVHANDVVNVLNSLRLHPIAEQTAEFDMTGCNVGASLNLINNVEDAIEQEEAIDRIMSQLTTTPVHVDEIIRSCDLPIALVLSSILELEIAGRLERHSGNRVNLI